MQANCLSIEAVKSVLRTSRIGSEVYVFDEIGSTNNEAKRRAQEGCADGAIFIADLQHNGRGRLANRTFVSPKGKGLLLSIVLRPPIAPTEASKCTLLAALGVVRAIRRLTGIDCGIKWPNDILADGKKLVGILTEMNADMDGVKYIVIGIGINVNIPQADFPEEIRSIATSIEAQSGKTINRFALLGAVCEELESAYDEMLERGFAPILTAWKQYSVTLGQTVRVIAPDETYTGRAVDLDEDGSLLVETAGGIKTVLAGDVSIRPQEN